MENLISFCDYRVVAEFANWIRFFLNTYPLLEGARNKTGINKFLFMIFTVYKNVIVITFYISSLAPIRLHIHTYTYTKLLHIQI